MSPKEIARVKRDFKAAWAEWRTTAGYLDCGAALAEHIRPELGVLRLKINRLAEILRQHDPEFPSSWSPL